MLKKLRITHLRNISSLTLEPAKFNMIVGANGSGKTSLLESIYLLGYGRSFRGGQFSHVIQHEQHQLSVFAEVISQKNLIPVGVERQRDGKRSIKIASEKVNLFAELAKLLPIQLINPDSFQLLNAGPSYRRKFLDWGVFHVEPSFWLIWRRYQQALKQRNAALKQRASVHEISAWDNELAETANVIDEQRKRYVTAFQPLYSHILRAFLPSMPVTICYFCGWNKQWGFTDALRESFAKDRVLGYTSVGPQRADIDILLNDEPVEQVFSRGQQKLLICAMLLAQGVLLQQLTGKSPIYLIDDLPSELDAKNCSTVFAYLKQLSSQLFVTCIQEAALSEHLDHEELKMFHMEHGIFADDARVAS